MNNSDNISRALRLQAWAATERVEAVRRAEGLRDILTPLAEAGHSLRYIAENLNRQDIPTVQGKKWHAEGIKRTLQRLEIWSPAGSGSGWRRQAA